MDYKGVVIFINEQIKQDTPTDVILKKIDYMNKLPILKKLFLKKRLAATDPLWKKIDNKTRLNRLFKRYERDYYTDPSQTLFSKLKRKLTRIPSEQKAIDLFGNLYSKEQALERKCIRLIEKIYKNVKTNVIHLPNGIVYYRDTKLLYIPANDKSSKYDYIYDAKDTITGATALMKNLLKLIWPVQHKLSQLRELYKQLSQIELTMFAQKKKKKVV